MSRKPTYRQLDYWSRLGYLRFDRDGYGSGYVRSWHPGEMEIAELMAGLSSHGVSLATAHVLARYEPEDAEEMLRMLDAARQLADAAAGDGVQFRLLEAAS